MDATEKIRGEHINASYICDSIMARDERTVKRLVIALILTIILFFASNCFWMYAWTSYDYNSNSTVTVDGKEGTANYIGNDGDIINGENSGQEDSDTN